MSLVIDHYEENWNKLPYVLIFGRARIMLRGKKHGQAVRLLRRKHRQYRAMAIHQSPIISVTVKKLIVWQPTPR